MFNIQLAFYGLVGALAVAAAAGGYGYYKGGEAADLACTAGKAKATIGQLTRDNTELSQLVKDNQTLQKGVNDAIAKQTEELNAVRVAVAGSTGAVKRLRTTTDTASVRISNATRTAAAEYATTVNAILAESTAEYRALGENADGHVADVRALRNGWPRIQPPQDAAVK